MQIQGMCSLYDLMSDDEVGNYFRANTAWRDGVMPPLASLSIYPGKPGRIVRLHEGERVVDTGLWGYPTTRPRKVKPKPGQPDHVVDWWQNARELDRPLWRKSCDTVSHRCLVPFTRFSEPKAAAARAAPDDRNWWFNIVDRPVAAFAGLWKDDPRFGRVYSFITTEPNAIVGAKHPKAMPVILDEEDFDRWLTEPWDQAKGLVTAYPSQLMAVA